MADRIIVVDDEREIADLIGLYLENDGYEVHKFLNGADALSFVEKCEPALAVLDVMLPDTDGFALLRKMREKHDFPIIMLTARVTDSDKILGLTIGADDYITKPFNPLEVTARVKTVLRRCRRGAGRRHLHGPAPRRLDAPVHRERRPHGPQTGGLRQLQPGDYGPRPGPADEKRLPGRGLHPG